MTGQQAELELLPAAPGLEQLSKGRITHILGDFIHSIPTRQPVRLALARSFPGEPRPVEEITPFYSAFGWSGARFDRDDLRGTYVLGDVELLQPYLAADLTAETVAAEANGADKTASSRRWDWLTRLWPGGRPHPESPDKINAGLATASEGGSDQVEIKAEMSADLSLSMS